MRYKSFLTLLISVALGVVSGYGLMLMVFSEIIPVVIGTEGIVYPIVLYSSLVFLVLLFSIIFQIILSRRITNQLIKFMMLSYYVILISVLFFRRSYESFIIINPFIGLADMFNSPEMMMQSIFNILLLLPMGFSFRNKGLNTILIFSLAISLGIECIQYIFRLGFFDTFDSILYIIGILTGRALFRRIDINKFLDIR